MNQKIEISFKTSANNVIDFAKKTLNACHNYFVITKNALQDGLLVTLKPLHAKLKYAVTLTMKQVAIIAPKHSFYKHRAYLTESVAKDQLRYFIKRLTHYAYGNDAKRKSMKDKSIPIVVPALEGGRSAIDGDKRMHWHLAIGNLPEMSFAEARSLILRAWNDCDFAHKQNEVREIHEVNGWLKYLTKGLLFGDSNAIEFDYLTYPKSIKFDEVKYLQINESSSALELG